jgi:hypothetical protein
MIKAGGIMKNGVFCAALALLVVSSQALDAQGSGLLGQLSTAETVPQGAVDLGAYVGFYDDANALFGQFRLGICQYCDWEVKSGVLDTEGEGDPYFMIGTAFKYHFYDRQDNAAPDMATSAIIEYYDYGENVSFWILGAGLIGSYPFKLSNNSTLTPYGRLCLRAERVKVGSRYKGDLLPEFDDRVDWDFDIGLNLGAQYAPTHRFQIYGEFQMDDQFGFIAGVNFAVY